MVQLLEEPSAEGEVADIVVGKAPTLGLLYQGLVT